MYPLLMLDGPIAPESSSLAICSQANFSDPYSYMQDLHTKATMQYVKRERQHYALFDGRVDLKGSKHRVVSEMDSRMVVSTREGGFDKGEERIGDYIYYTRARGDNGSAATSTDVSFYRKKVGDADVLGEELIDPHTLRRQFGYEHCNVGVCRVSEDGSLLAFTIAVEGGDRYICHVKSMDSAAIYHVIRSSNIVSIEFGSGNNFFYTECNELNRPHKVMMQVIQPGLLPDPIEIYRDDDEEFFVDVRKTKDSKFLALSSDSKARGNVLVLPASYPTIPRDLKHFFPDGKPVEIAGKEGWGWLEHHGNCFLMVTSLDAPNFKIVYVRDEQALRHGRECKEWRDFLPHNPNIQITDIDIFATSLVVFEATFGYEKNGFAPHH